jgi:putative ATPase
MELAVETTPASWPPPPGTEITVSMEAAEESIQRRAVLYDKDGDYHFDTISAFIKSVRGSDPDAALYWMAKMVRAGEDPSFIFRRMILLASEDVGLADPHALAVVISCAEAFDRIGFPEGNFPLAHACLYLATAPKSNTALSFFDALKEVDREDAEVPNHLRDASRDAESFGHGEGYVYPHAYRDHWAAQQYLPGALRGRTFYIPSIIGYEGKIREDVLQKREIQAAIVLGDSSAADGELLTWSAAAKGREGWFKRLESGRGKLLLNDRDALFTAASPSRHSRVLIPLANDGLLLWESLRRCPEGLTAALVDSGQARDALLRYGSVLDQIDLPEIGVLKSALLPTAEQAEEWFSVTQFDYILLREPWRRTFSASGEAVIPAELFSACAAQAQSLLTANGTLCVLCSPPSMGERISRVLLEECDADAPLVSAVRAAEAQFFDTHSGTENHKPWNWNEKTLITAFEASGFTVHTRTIDQQEERIINEKDLASWFDTEHSRWGMFFNSHLSETDFLKAKETLAIRIQQGPLLWKWTSILLQAYIER